MITIITAALVIGAMPTETASSGHAGHAPTQTQPSTASAFGKPALDGSSLRSSTAREDISQISSADQSANVSNNSVTGQSTTGNVQLDGNAFSNMSGLAIVNANSGNNVAINAAMNVNVVFAPPPAPPQQ